MIEKTPPMRNTPNIKQALEELLLQPEQDGSFVIFEERRSKKFVQFTGSRSNLLQLDLPSQTLSEVEFYRAVDYFREWYIAGEEYEVFDAPGGSPVGDQFTFQMTFRSVEIAANVVWDVFEDIYQFPGDCRLEITKGWLD